MIRPQPKQFCCYVFDCGERPELTQEELAFECELHRTYISGVERGVRNPTVLALRKIATALGIEPGRLLDRK